VHFRASQSPRLRRNRSLLIYRRQPGRHPGQSWGIPVTPNQFPGITMGRVGTDVLEVQQSVARRALSKDLTRTQRLAPQKACRSVASLELCCSGLGTCVCRLWTLAPLALKPP
jgi:hypothetical protein